MILLHIIIINVQHTRKISLHDQVFPFGTNQTKVGIEPWILCHSPQSVQLSNSDSKYWIECIS